MVVIIPAAGAGKRFADEGYTVPKPYVPVAGTPMIMRVIEMFDCLQMDASWHSIVAVTHINHVRHFVDLLPDYVDTATINRTPEGAALSVLFGALSSGVEEDDEVVVCNSDNLFHPDTVHAFLSRCQAEDCMGAIMTVAVDPAGPCIWSYVHSARNNIVTNVTEKKFPTGLATAGLYYFRQWKELRRAIAFMVAAEERTNNEFYLAPVYNHLAGRVIHWLMPEKHFWPVGTPEQLRQHEQRIRDGRAA